MSRLRPSSSTRLGSYTTGDFGYLIDGPVINFMARRNSVSNRSDDTENNFKYPLSNVIKSYTTGLLSASYVTNNPSSTTITLPSNTTLNFHPKLNVS